LTILETAKSSKTIVWFSRIILVDSLWRKSVRVSLIFVWSLATRFLATSRRLLPFCFLESLRCNRLSFLRCFFNQYFGQF
jgi:hypothetical protein